MRNPKRKKRLLDIAPDVFLKKLYEALADMFVSRCEYSGTIDRRWCDRVMKKNVDLTVTDTSLVLLVHTEEDDTVNGIFSCATFISDDDTHAVFVLDERRGCHLTGMIQEVFENLMDEYTSKYPSKPI